MRVSAFLSDDVIELASEFSQTLTWNMPDMQMPGGRTTVWKSVVLKGPGMHKVC